MLKNGERLYEITRKVMQFAAWISIAVVVFNLVLLSANVFMRYVFNAPIKGTSEIVTMMMAWVAYMGMAYTLLNEKHMQLEAIYEKLHGRVKHIASFCIYLLATVLFVFFVKASFDVFWQSWSIKEESVASVTVYVFIGKFGTFLGWVLLAVQAALMTIYSALGMLHPDQYEPIGVFSELLDEESVNQLLNDEVMSRVQKNDQAESKKGGDNA